MTDDYDEDIEQPVEVLSEHEVGIVAQLPDQPGYYWVESMLDGRLSIARINKSDLPNALDYWGEVMPIEPGMVTLIERFLDANEILEMITPMKVETGSMTDSEEFGLF